MISAIYCKDVRYALIFLFQCMPLAHTFAAKNEIETLSPEKINLALRRTADGLLRNAGDSTSRIPAIEQTKDGKWQVRLEQTFSYELLPVLLHKSLELHGITQSYDVTVRRCDDGTIDLGYNYMDFMSKSGVACGGREMPKGCHYIEIAFLNVQNINNLWLKQGAGFFLLFSSLAGFWLFNRKKSKTLLSEISDTDWVEFGHSRLDVANQILICSGIRHTLTYRETKLLMLFATHSGQLLERDYIIQQVWADEGVLVGRSVDVFVSRLRKKLVNDPTIGLAVVHGIGYRLEALKLS